MYLIVNDLSLLTRQVTDNTTPYWILDPRLAQGEAFEPIWLGTDAEMTLKRESGGIQKAMNIKYEGTSHDVIDNKAPIFLSHDVDDGQGITRCQVLKF